MNPEKLKERRMNRGIPWLRDKLDEVFSKYIRTHYPPVCITCGRDLRGKKFDAGHWIARGSMATRWDEDNVRPQCVPCNQHDAGRPYDFEQALIGEIGRTRVEEIKALRHTVRKWSREELADLIAEYEQRVSDREAA